MVTFAGFKFQVPTGLYTKYETESRLYNIHSSFLSHFHSPLQLYSIHFLLYTYLKEIMEDRKLILDI